MGRFDNLWRTLKGHGMNINEAITTLEKNTTSIEDLAINANGRAPKQILECLGNIDGVLDRVSEKQRPDLNKKGYSTEWRQNFESNAWIEYFMNMKLFELEKVKTKDDEKEEEKGKEKQKDEVKPEKRSFHQMMDYWSPVILKEPEEAIRHPEFRNSFNLKYTLMVDRFEAKVIAEQRKLKEQGIELNYTRKDISNAVHDNLMDFWFGQLEVAINKGDIEPSEIDKGGIRFYPYGSRTSKFYTIADRIHYLINKLDDKEKASEKITKLRNLEIQGFEELKRKSIDLVENEKPNLGGRANVLRNVFFFAEHVGKELQDQHNDADPDALPLDLIEPTRPFYERAIKKLFSDLDPSQIGMILPSPKSLKGILDATVKALNDSTTKYLVGVAGDRFIHGKIEFLDTDGKPVGYALTPREFLLQIDQGEGGRDLLKDLFEKKDLKWSREMLEESPDYLWNLISSNNKQKRLLLHEFKKQYPEDYEHAVDIQWEGEWDEEDGEDDAQAFYQMNHFRNHTKDHSMSYLQHDLLDHKHSAFRKNAKKIVYEVIESARNILIDAAKQFDDPVDPRFQQSFMKSYGVGVVKYSDVVDIVQNELNILYDAHIEDIFREDFVDQEGSDLEKDLRAIASKAAKSILIDTPFAMKIRDEYVHRAYDELSGELNQDLQDHLDTEKFEQIAAEELRLAKWEAVKSGFQDLVDQTYRDNIGDHLGDMVKNLRFVIGRLDFRAIRLAVNKYDAFCKEYALYMPEGFEPEDPEVVKESEFRGLEVKNSTSIKEIYDKCDEETEKAFKEDKVNEGLSNLEAYIGICRAFPKLLETDEAVLKARIEAWKFKLDEGATLGFKQYQLEKGSKYLDGYLSLCDIFPDECGETEESMKAKLEELQDHIFKRAEAAKKFHKIQMMEQHIENYLIMTKRYSRFLEPEDRPDVYKKLGFKQAKAVRSEHPTAPNQIIIEIIPENEEESQESDSQ